MDLEECVLVSWGVFSVLWYSRIESGELLSVVQINDATLQHLATHCPNIQRLVSLSLSLSLSLLPPSFLLYVTSSPHFSSRRCYPTVRE